MANSFNNKIVATAISFGSYFFCVLLLLFYMNTSPVLKIDSASQETILDLEIILGEDNAQKDSISQKAKSAKNSDASSKIVKKTSSSSVKKKARLDGLFANIKLNTDDIFKEDIDNTKANSVASRHKSDISKQIESEDDTVSKLLDTISNSANRPSDIERNKQTDAYFSNIREIISKKWIPVSQGIDINAKVMVTIDKYGVFSYRFLSYSKDDLFNEQLTRFLNAQTLEIYPTRKDANEATIEMIFGIKGVDL